MKVVYCDAGPVHGAWVEEGKPPVVLRFSERLDVALRPPLCELEIIRRCLRNQPPGSALVVRTDSEDALRCISGRIPRGKYAERIADLCLDIWETIERKQLAVRFERVPRDRNPAGLVLEGKRP